MTRSDDRTWPSREDRSTFAALADVLVPRVGDMPSASEVDISGRRLDHVLGSRPDMVESLISTLENARGLHPEEAILRLESEDPENFATLFTAVAGGYYMSEEVRSILGYTGQRALNADAEEQLEALTRTQIERGPIYREAY